MHVDACAHVAEGVVPVVESLLDQPAPVWSTHHMLVQRDAEVALVQDGQLQSVAVASGPAPQNGRICQPQIHQVGHDLHVSAGQLLLLLTCRMMRQLAVSALQHYLFSYRAHLSVCHGAGAAKCGCVPGWRP